MIAEKRTPFFSFLFLSFLASINRHVQRMPLYMVAAKMYIIVIGISNSILARSCASYNLQSANMQRCYAACKGGTQP